MDNLEKNLLDELGDNLKINECLRNHVSFGVGGVADFYFVANDINELVKAVSAAKKNKIPYFVLGGGYNIVPADSGFPGLVIKNASQNIAFSGDNSQVIVDSGVNISKLVNTAASRDLGGLEFMFGIPGTIGGAIYGNAGAFGYEIGDFVKSLILLIVRDDEIKIVKKDQGWMNFSYRSSRLKENSGEKFPPVLLTVKLQLVKRRRDEILKFMQENITKKKSSQPVGEKSAGSFFKNPGEGAKTAAGYLLDQAGAKKLRIGGAAFSKKHANFIINKKNATASELRKLADEAKRKVKDKFNIDLDEEIEYIGKW